MICVGTGAAGDSAHLRAFVAAFDEDGSLHIAEAQVGLRSPGARLSKSLPVGLTAQPPW